jgi:hypothetical protein
MPQLTNILHDLENPLQSMEKELLHKLLELIEGRTTGPLLEVLLDAMSLVFRLDKNYRRNIEDFTAAYQLQEKQGGVSIGFSFANEKMTVEKKGVKNPNISVTFKDNAAINEFLFSSDPDILSFVLDSKVSYDGNLNYLMKFAYMAKHLQLMILKK